MQHDRGRKASGGKWLGIAAGISLTLGGCGGAAEATLPADRQESAALCYGATLALAQEKVGKASVPVDPAAQALHFVLLAGRSEEHTSELQSLMRISYAVFCLKKKK